jgi:hypothetical protein
MSKVQNRPSQTTRFSLPFVTLAVICGLMSGCGPTDADKISDAQTCLNTATADMADLCVAMVDGIYSQSASLIRCSGAFIKEGFGDSTKVKQALSQLDNNGNGASGSMAMMSVLAFQSDADKAVNLASAQAAQTECIKSGSPGLIFLSGVSLTASQAVALINPADPTNITPTDISNGLASLASGSAQDQATVGSAILSIYDVSCQNGSSTAGNYCQQFQSVIDQVGSDPASVGQFLATCYTTPATPGCSGF